MKKVVVTCDECGAEMPDRTPEICDNCLRLKTLSALQGVKRDLEKKAKLPTMKSDKLDRFKVSNETEYPTREVKSIVTWVMRYLEVNHRPCMVKVKHHNGIHAYQGRFYPHPHSTRGYVYSYYWGEEREVRPNVPRDMSYLIVCRIGKPGVYPTMTHVYDRKDAPEPWEVADWREALVSITAHEAFHLRQHTAPKSRNAGKFNEVDTEWAAYRLLQEWKKEMT